MINPLRPDFNGCRCPLFAGLLLVGLLAESVVALEPVEFNRDIRPILSDSCFSCHGPDEKARQGGLRLDLSEPARTQLASGKNAIVPGEVTASELIRRISSSDPNEQMPPPDSGKHVTPSQAEMLKRWILQGAAYQRHWSLVPPARPRRSPVEQRDAREANPIDSLIVDRLQREGLGLVPAADKERLIRRVTLDLTGTPPTLGEIDDFVSDQAADAYERMIDRLLASPRYGERMSLDWLDAARYADTHGFNNDTTRYMWRWRDWTIHALNSGMPFDQFVTEQLAGDLLPNPTLDQQIATGFNRNHVINSEGGIIPEEYRVEYVADRVHTTSTIFLGLSLGCARCHDHKFDPLTQREYYQFFAFFNQLNEQGEAGRAGNADPMIKAPTTEQSQRLARLTQQRESFERSLQQRLQLAQDSIPQWEPTFRETVRSKEETIIPRFRWTLDEQSGSEVSERGDPNRKGQVIGKPQWVTGKLAGAMKLDGNTHIEAGDVASFERTDRFSYGAWVNLENKEGATVVSRMDDGDAFRGFDLLLVGGKLTAHLVHHWPDDALHVVSKTEVPLNQWKHVFATYDGSAKAEGFQLYLDGQRLEVEITNNHLTGTTITTKPLRIGRRTPGAPLKGMIDDVRIYDRELTPAEVLVVAQRDGLADLLAIGPDQRNAEQTQQVINAYVSRFDTDFQGLTSGRDQLDQQRADLEKLVPSAMVMQEMPQRRSTFLLKRGQYDAPGDEVQPDVPASLPPFPPEAPRNRLGLAQWLLAPDHPLTARVAVNRAWMQFFGSGLVETVEDFGSQGQWPSHLDLIDWLAIEYSGSGLTAAGTPPASGPRWDTKRLHRLIVNSATYRQSSRVSAAMNERDPANQLLARGPRFRMQAELIRDNALAIAGLLSDRIGGPSVSPYQPAGLWDDVAVGADYEGTVYKQDQGEGLYRRSMYTFWKRTCPPPGLNTFDAPEREVCTARRSRTNTPLQALVLMNDPTYLEAARKLAERTMVEGGDSIESRLTYAFRLVLSRKPSPIETDVLAKAYRQQRERYQHDPARAKSLITSGDSPQNKSLEETELAAWTAVMSLLLNLDEAITKG
jgi:hypothetical protein